VARSALRREWLAAVAVIALMSVQPMLLTQAPWWIAAPMVFVLRLIPVFLALRFGLLAVISSFAVAVMLCEMPIASDLTSWAGLPALGVFAVVAALAGYGFQTATGGRALSFGLND
jgi:hypothetical protein